MRAGQVSGPGKFDVVEVADPAPTEGQILVRMRSASICGSDLHRVFAEDGLDAYPLPPGRPGHEGVGVVVDSRSAKHCPGQMVLTVPVAGAGAAYAELQVVGEDFAITLPAETDLDRALMAQQLGTVVFGWHRYWPDGRPATGLRAGVIGAGSAGLFALQLARLAGFEEVVISDLEQSRLAVAEKLGAARTVLAPGESFVEAAKELTDGAGLDLVVDATGFDACRADCVEAVRYHGRIGFFGLPEQPGLAPFPVSGAFRKGCTIEMAGVAQLEPGLKAFREALDLIATGKVDVDSMIEQRYPLERFGEAMAAARAHVAPKVNVDITPR
ncbi:MAG: zinc-binding dehydrogenase [Acidimicrobiaceae bacterium]|nr:zinc-binding dehydrogenase [Acidimicrobiaceae bacterium]